MAANSTQTLPCTYLSAVLLAGLILNATLGWSWADPTVGLVIAAVAVTECLKRGAATTVARPSDSSVQTPPAAAGTIC